MLGHFKLITPSPPLPFCSTPLPVIDLLVCYSLHATYMSTSKQANPAPTPTAATVHFSPTWLNLSKLNTSLHDGENSRINTSKSIHDKEYIYAKILKAT